MLNKPVVGMAATPDGGGYWLVASDGGIFSYGDAGFYGSTGSMVLNKPVVGMTPTPDGKGYWLVASDGGIFSYGDARFFGSTGSMVLNKPVVGMAATPSGNGYWLVASDGGIFSYGDSHFDGSTGGMVLNKPIVGMITGPGGGGYFLVASDGGIFSYGTMQFYGSLGGVPLKNPITAAATTPTRDGYWFTDTAGLVSNFGNAKYYGSAPSPLFRPIVGMAEAPGTRRLHGGHVPVGRIRLRHQHLPVLELPDRGPPDRDRPGGRQLLGEHEPVPGPGGVVGRRRAEPLLLLDLHHLGHARAGVQRRYLLQRAATRPASSPIQTRRAPAPDPPPSRGGSTSRRRAPTGRATTPRTPQFVQGAINALHETEGIPDVGIYASPGVWNNIVGNYQPDVPYWMADYLSPPSGPSSCADIGRWQSMGKQLPSGPLEIVQYDSEQYDMDYAC